MNISKEKFQRWRRLIITFFIGQSTWQILRMLTGFALIRWLDKDEYATFTLVLAIQGTAAVLIDLGFSGGLIALIGNRCDNSSVVGRYIAVAKYYRNRLIAVGTVGLIIVFYLASSRFEWGWALGLALWFFMVSTLIFEAQESFYDPVLSLQQRLNERYVIWLKAALLRLGLLGAAYLFGWLSAPVALAAGAMESFFSALSIKRKASDSIQAPDAGDDLSEEKKEALALTLPKVPGAIFFALRGQVTIFIVGILGQYDQIASIGALSKLGLLFLMPRAFTGALVTPWFSKLKQERLLLGYSGVMLLYLTFGGTLLLVNFLFPHLFLWVLGPAYASLEYEVFLFSISAVFSLLTGLNYFLASSRKWVYYWTGPASIVSYLVILVYFVIFVDLSLISNVILLSVMTAVADYLINQAAFIVGYSRSRSES